MRYQDLPHRFDGVLEQISRAAERSGRAASSVQLVAVSKMQEASAVAALAVHWSRFGQAVFGENYVQEALPKMAETRRLLADVPGGAGGPNPHWHFLGHIQRRKAKDVLGGQFALIHSLDSLKLAQALQKSWEKSAAYPDSGPVFPQEVLIQVNIGQEAQKSGIDPGQLEALCLELMAFSGLRLGGLMCLPPNMGEGEAVRPYFIALRRLAEDLRQKTGLPLPHLSMGMSGDFEQAVEEGATLVRIGTSIFGERPKA